MSDTDVNGHLTDETGEGETEPAADGASAIERYEPEHPWQRQPGESSRAFGRFCEYRDLGANRSLSRLGRLHADQAGWSLRALEELSVRWRWQARASAWDDDEDKARRLAQAQAAIEMAERQARDDAARVRGEELLDAHRRVRAAARQTGVSHRVEPQLPPDVLGIYIYLPA